MRKTAIYKIIDPRNQEVRYIGKTLQPIQRFSAHRLAALKTGQKKYVYNWIRQILNAGLKPIFEIIEWVENWEEREQYWIDYYRNLGSKLTNLANGGKGSNGTKHTKEWKNEASKRMIGNTIMNGRKLSEETKAKMSASQAARQARPVNQYDLDGNLIKTWPCVQCAATELAISKSSISNVLAGINAKNKHGIWKYV